MAIDERSRHELYVRLEGVLGPEAATTLMEHLPPVGWADVATKRDLDLLAARIDLRFEQIDQRFEQTDQRFETLEYKILATFRGELQTALTAQTRQLTIALVGTAGALATVALAAAGLT